MRFAICFVLLSAAMPGQSKLTAAKLLTDADAKEFMGAVKFDRQGGDLGPAATTASIKAMADDVFSHHLTLYLQPMPAQIPNYPNYVKDMVEQASSTGRKLECTVKGAAASACMEVDSPLGSFKDGQKMVKVVFGRGRNFVKIDAFRDFQADLEAVVKLAEKIVARLP